MAISTDGLSGDSLKRAEAYNRALGKAEKSLERQKKVANDVSSALLGVDGSKFFKSLNSGEQAKRMEELKAISKNLNSEAKAAGEQLNNTFQEMIEGSGLVNKSAEEIAMQLQISKEEASKLEQAFKSTDESGAGIASLLQDMGDSGEKLVDTIVKDGNFEENLVDQFKETLDTLKEIDTELEVTKDQMNHIDDQVFSIKQGFAAIGENLTKDFTLTSLVSDLMDFDKTIKQAQIDSGINFTQNASQMAMLTSETARFGMSVQDTTGLMTELGSELRTSNFDTLSEATNDLAAMQKATGLSAKNVAKLTKEFVMFGQSAKDAADYSGEVMAEAQMFGLNGRELMEDIAGNLKNMRRMGFVGGEQSLKRMVTEAKYLGMEVDEVFNVAKKARNIEGAMEMAAELQLAGGSFAAIDPMQLLSAARKGPEELTKILGSMGADIGHFNKKTGEYEFDPIDADRLSMVADATGMELDSLQNMIAKNAGDNQKLDLLPPSLMGADLSDEERMFLMNATKIGENGALELTADVNGISDLSNLTQEQIQAGMKEAKDKKDFLEEQAQQNMGFQESKDALMASITNLFSAFQPVLQVVTDLINQINTLGPKMKMVIGGLIIGLKLLFGPAKSYMQGIQIGKGMNVGMQGGGFMDKIKGFFGKGGKAGAMGGLPGQKEIETTAGQGGEVGGAASKSGGGLKGLAEGLKAMGDTSVFKGILAMALAGPAMIMFLPAIPGLFLLSGLGLLSAPLIAGFGALKTGYSMMGGALTEIAKGALAMALVGISILPFVFAAQIMSEVDWLNVLFGVGVMALVVLGLVGLGALMMVALPFLLMGALGLIIAGGAMFIAGTLLAGAVEPLSLIAETDWSTLVPFADAIGAFGFGLVFSAMGLLAGAVALYFAAPMLAASIAPLMAVAGQDWSGLVGFSQALYAVGPAMIAFALAGLAMFNPLMLLGMVTMLGAISMLGNIMSTLGPDLDTGARGIERMAEGVGKLEAAIAAMDTEKLSKLRGLASTIAKGGENIGKFANAVGGGGGGAGGGSQTIKHVVVLELDGKKLKEIELRDNKYTT